MKRENINYFVVGSVVLIAFALLFYALIRLTGGVGEQDPYHVYYSNVGGLKEGTPVSYEGFKVGSVAGIVPEHSETGTRYRIDILIRDGWRIPIGSSARIYSEGLLAETVINIDEGQSTRFLPLGSELEGIQNTDLFSSVNTAATDVSQLLNDDVKPLLQNMNANISSLGDHMNQGLPVILHSIEQLLASLRSSADRLPRLLDETSESRIDAILKNTQQMSSNLLVLSQALMETQKKADMLLAESNGALKDNRKDINMAVVAMRRSLEDLSAHSDGILRNLESTTQNLNEFSRKIRRSPGLLLHSRPPAEVGVTYE